jgi:hypothetical protein
VPADGPEPRLGWSDEHAAVMFKARQQADGAERLVCSVSSQRLAELMRAPTRSAMTALDDPALTERDRLILVEHLSSSGSASTKLPKQLLAKKAVGLALELPYRVTRRFSFRSILCGVALVTVLIPLAMAWQATPFGEVTLSHVTIVPWQWNGRDIGIVGYPAGTRFEAMSDNQDDATIGIRGWTPGRGYYYASIAWREFR